MSMLFNRAAIVPMWVVVLGPFELCGDSVDGGVKRNVSAVEARPPRIR